MADTVTGGGTVPHGTAGHGARRAYEVIRSGAGASECALSRADARWWTGRDGLRMLFMHGFLLSLGTMPFELREACSGAITRRWTSRLLADEIYEPQNATMR